jgi:phenylalanyl-tRNA synthetase beta chain
MRPSLVPSLLEKTALNQKHYARSRFFEIGRSYIEDEKDFSQDRHQVGIVFYDKNRLPVPGLAESRNGSFRKSGNQCPDRRNPTESIPEPDDAGRLDRPIHLGEFLDIQVMGKTCGFIGTIHPLMARNFKIKGNAVMALIDITDFMDPGDQRIPDEVSAAAQVPRIDL